MKEMNEGKHSLNYITCFFLFINFRTVQKHLTGVVMEMIIKWHSVIHDGLPKKSGDYLVHNNNHLRTDIYSVRYSAKHKAFNVYDYEPEPIHQLMFDWWAEIPATDEDWRV